MKQQLNESLDYLDMKDQVLPRLGVDLFKSTVGEDADMIVLNFTVHDELVAQDLVDWFERGYDWIVDAEPSPGEVHPNRYYVFVEMDRRSSAPERIMELIDDLTTLTGLKPADWQVNVNGKTVPADTASLRKAMQLSAADYRRTHQEPLNEYRHHAGLPVLTSYDKTDADLRAMQDLAQIRK
jgi:hypothetical protein